MSKDAWQNLGLATLTAMTLAAVVYLFGTWPPQSPPSGLGQVRFQPEPVASPEPDPGLATVFMGDSITQADTLSFEESPGPFSWVSYAIDAPDSPWDYQANVAVGGEQTAEMLARFDRDVLSREPEGVVILGGTNDAGNGVPVSETISNLRKMVLKAQRTDARVWLVSLPPRTPYSRPTALLRKAEAELADSLDVPFLDPYPALTTRRGTWKPGYTIDGVHPSQRGAQVLARAVLASR